MTNVFHTLWNKSFKTQLIYGFGFILATLIITFTSIITSFQSDFLKKEGIKQAENRSLLFAMTSKVWVMANDYIGLDEVVSNFALYDDVLFAMVINLDGKIIAHTDKALVGKYIADTERLGYLQNLTNNTREIPKEEIIYEGHHFIDILRPIHQKKQHLAFVHMRFDQKESHLAIEQTINNGLLFTLVSILITIMFAYFVANGLTQNLSKLIKTIQQFKEGNKYIKADEEGVQEIRKLSYAFNDLIETINNSEKLNQKLTERLELAFFATQDGLWDWDITDDTIYYSPIWKEMIGFKEDELPNEVSSWTNRVHPDDLSKVLADLNDHIEGKTEKYHNTHRLLTKEGEWIWTLDRGKALFDKDSKAIRMVGTHSNVTKEKEIQLQQAHQAQIIEQMVDSIISTDLEGSILNWNYGSEVIFGYKSSQMVGQNIEIIYENQEKDFFKKSVGILLKEGKFHQDILMTREEGEVLSLSLSLTLLKDEEGKPNSVVCYSQDITFRKIAEEELKRQRNSLEYQANYDLLTKLPNRFFFQNRLTQAIEKAKEQKRQLAIFFIDLDRFKQINDSLGHNIGDKVLQIVGNKLKNIIGQSDTLARLGGDEFTILMEEVEEIKEASLLAQKILEILVEPMRINDHTLYISSSIGISLYPQDGKDANNLLKYADAAMYRAKDEGRDNFQFYSSEMTMMASAHITMDTSLREALVHNEFIVYYQAQMDAEKEVLIGMEALIRWNHPQMGLILPSKFIHLAEETGLIISLNQWMMKTAIKQWVEWYNAGLKIGKLSLNLAMKELQQKDFLETLREMLEELGCHPQWLILEVTEGQIMANPEQAIIILNEISSMGIELAVDDFGTGYSSLAYLKRLPINKLKIDQSFIRDLPDDEEDSVITKSVIALAKSLNLEVIAEGVETQAQRDFLVQNGCVNIQGYFYSKPMPFREMEKILLANIS